MYVTTRWKLEDFGSSKKRLRALSLVSDFMLGWGWLSWNFKQGLWRKLCTGVK